MISTSKHIHTEMHMRMGKDREMRHVLLNADCLGVTGTIIYEYICVCVYIYVVCM